MGRGELHQFERRGPGAPQAGRTRSSVSPALLLEGYPDLASPAALAPQSPEPSLFTLTRDCMAQHAARNSTQAPAMAAAGLASTSTGSSLVVCNDSQLSLMNIRPEEFNFSDIERVWLVKSWQEILLRVALVAPIVLLGLLGNATIIYSMCRFKPIRSKPTNVFILNMALADLLTTIFCPNAALLTDIHQFYVLGAFVCRTEGFIKITCLLVSAYSLIVLSFDWFLSVVRPCRSRIGVRQSWLTLASIWLVSVVMAAPLLFSRRLRERHWRDLTEVWCCELIQYTKYYWVCMTFFLIYLPTFVMTIVLVVILARMDRFEAKLRRSRSAAGCAPGARAGPSLSRSTLRSPSSALALRSSSFSIALDSLNQTTNSATATTSASRAAARAACGPLANNSSLSISMKYRRRIVKILFFYLLTSIVCWTPLQFTIIYRHFRREAVPAGWFFELSFFSQLCASLSAAMNPIIFGFLSQPFRRVVVKSWLFRLVYKLWVARGRHPPAPPADKQPPQAPNHNGPRNNWPDGEACAAAGRPLALVSPPARMGPCAYHRPISQAQHEQRATPPRDHQARLASPAHVNGRSLQRRQSTLSRTSAVRKRTDSKHCAPGGHYQPRPKSTSMVSEPPQSPPGRHLENHLQRSHSSLAHGASRHPNGGHSGRARHCNGRAGRKHGVDNEAYTQTDDGNDSDDDHTRNTHDFRGLRPNGLESKSAPPPAGSATTSFMVQNGAVK